MLQRGHEDLDALRRANPVLFLKAMSHLGEERAIAEKTKPTSDDNETDEPEIVKRFRAAQQSGDYIEYVFGPSDHRMTEP